MSSSAKGYGLRVAAAAGGLLVFSSLALYGLFAGLGEHGPRGVFGNPFDAPGDRGKVVAIHPESVAPVRVGRPGGQTSPAPAPAAATPPADPVPATLSGGGTATAANAHAPTPRSSPAAALERARRYVAAKDWTRAAAAYDRLLSANPGREDIAAERARVLGWSGNHRAAAAAFADPITRDPANVQLRLEQAQQLWWAGQVAEADAAVSELLQIDETNAEARALRMQIRHGASPDAVLALQWLREQPGPAEHLLLARAYAREGKPGAALAPYRIALESGTFPDSLYLELASIAATADSSYIAAMALERFLRAHPGERDARIRLARAYAWSARPHQAIAAYDELLATADDPALRFERAQLYAWSGDHARAEQEALRVLELDATHAPSLKLLGDLARWRGDAPRALALYARASALDGGLDGVEEGQIAARGMITAAGGPAAPAAGRLLPEWQSEVEAFNDSERFRWLSLQATRSWGSASRSWSLTAHQDVSGGGPVAQPESAAAGFGAEVQGRLGFRNGATLGASLGAHGADHTEIDATWGAEAGVSGPGGGFAHLRYQRQPAVRRAASIAAREVGASSDLVQLTVTHPLWGWSAWYATELERFSSRLGSSSRLAGSAAFSRPLTPSLTASFGINALGATEDSPLLPGYGPLYWSPELYLAPSAGLLYQANAGERWKLAGRLHPGVAFVRERRDSDRRYDSDWTPVAAAGLDASYLQPAWELSVSGDWSGVMGPGYQAAALRARFAFFPGRR